MSLIELLPQQSLIKTLTQMLVIDSFHYKIYPPPPIKKAKEKMLPINIGKVEWTDIINIIPQPELIQLKY
jgi:hypothetical protein